MTNLTSPPPESQRPDLSELHDVHPEGEADVQHVIWTGLNRDQWAGSVILRDELPLVPRLTALPAASERYRGRIALILGSGATNDIPYICRRLGGGSYEWTALGSAT